jgi:hypothetical protein
MIKFAAVRNVGAIIVVDILESSEGLVVQRSTKESVKVNLLHEEGDIVDDVYGGPEASRPAYNFTDAC